MTVRRRWSGARNRLECCPAGRAGSLAQDPRAGELVCPGAVSAWAGDDDLKRARGRLAQPEVGDGRAVILERLFDECGEVRTVRGARVAAWHEGHRVGLRQVRHRAGRLGGRDSTTAVPRRVTFARAWIGSASCARIWRRGWPWSPSTREVSRSPDRDLRSDTRPSARRSMRGTPMSGTIYQGFGSPPDAPGLPARIRRRARQKGALVTKLTRPGLHVVNTHPVANWDGDWSRENRFYALHQAQLAGVAGAVRAGAGPAVVCGDFNIDRGSSLFGEFMTGTGLADAFKGNCPPTFRAEYLPAGRTPHCIDFILTADGARANTT